MFELCASLGGPGGHYYPSMSVDPWLTTTYDSDTTGVATVSLQVEDFSLGGTNPVAGRTIVVHDSSGIRIGCGVLQTTAGEIVSVGAYPASSTDYTVTGTLVVTNFLSNKKNGIKIEGTLGGLEASKDGGIHIHSGFTCDETEDNNGASVVGTSVGGQYYEGMDTNPWNTTYTSDTNGVATVSLEMEDFSLYKSYPVAYRAVVVHLSSDLSGARVGCGLIGTTTKAVATVASYPDYSGTYASSITGTIVVEKYNDGIIVSGTLGGVESDVASAGIHIHSGVSCADTGTEPRLTRLIYLCHDNMSL